jgi:hypothetical protein
LGPNGFLGAAKFLLQVDITNLLQQQAKFDVFMEKFNNERPHEALDMKCPTEV